MNLPDKSAIRKDPRWHALTMLWLELEKLERIKKKLALKVAQLLEYQWERWSSLPQNKKKNLNRNLSWIAKLVLERMKWRQIWEKISKLEIKAFRSMKI
jgi:hypothetical protein